MQIARASQVPAGSATAERLDALGRTALVTISYRPISGNNPKPPLQRVATAFPTWNEATIQESQELEWDDFWSRHAPGAGRITSIGATSFEDAVRAARELSLTTRPGLPPGDKQAQAVLQLADGSFHLASLGGVIEAERGAFVVRMGTYPGYWRPTFTSAVPELVAVVGGASMVDLRGKQGVPVQS